MKDEGKTREELLSELEEARFRLKQLEHVSAPVKHKKSIHTAEDSFASGFHLKDVLDTIGDPVFVKDREHRFVFVNEAFCALGGRKRGEFLGKTDLDFFPREQVDVFLEKDEEVFRTGQVNLNEETITDAGGRLRTIVTKKTLYTDDAGNPFIVGVIRDITERRRAEDERLKLSAVVETAQVFIGLADLEGNVLYVNPAGARMTGISNAGMEKLRITDFIPEAHRETFAARIMPELMEKGVWQGELQMRSPISGEIMDIDNTTLLVRDPVDQRPLYIATVIQDISRRKKAERELRESEKKYRSIFENIQDVYYEVSAEGTILEVSPSILMISDYTRDELLGKNIFEYYVDPGARQLLLEQIGKTGWVVDYEIVFKNRDGSPIPCAITSRLIRDEEHPEGKIVGVMREIGRRKAMEEAVARETNIRRVLTDLSSRLISSYSLEDISDFVLDTAKGLTDSLFGFVGYIDQQTGHLVNSTMSRDVWEICNVDKKSFVFHEFKGLWGWVLNNRQSLFSNDAANDSRSGGVPAGHVAIERFVSVPVMDGDRLMGQIALANSSRLYTEEDISLLKRLGAIFMLALQRKWSDIEREKLIDDLRKALAEVKKLSGLLPICASCKKVRNDRGYWEQIETYVREHSEADFSHGICPDCFRKLYPGFEPNSQAHLPGEGKKKKGRRSESMTERIKVLLVEDLPEDAELIERELRKSGFDFDMRWVETRQTYVQSLDAFTPDIILSDYALPSFNGMEALKIRNERAPLVPFLLVTGSINEETAVECMRTGATDYLIKGHLERLGPSVRSALEEKKVREEKAEVERNLSDSEKKYREFVELLPQTVFELDPGGNFLFVNKTGFEILGYGPQDLAKELHISRVIVAEDHDRLASNMRKRLKGFAATDMGYKALRKDGRSFPAIIFLQPIMEREKPVGLRGVLVDISELKKTEGELLEERRLLNLLLNHSTDGIYFKDREGRFSRISKTLADRFGLAAPGLAVGKTDFDFLSRGVAAESLAEENEIIRSGRPIAAKEDREVLPDGREIWVSTSKNPIVDDDGTVTGTFGISRDITRQKQSELELKRHLEELSLLNEAAGAFVSKNSLSEMYEYLGDLIQKLSAAPYLLISSLDPPTQSIFIRRALGVDMLLPEITKKMGLDPMKLAVSIADMSAEEFRLFTSRKLIKIEGGLHTLAGRKVSPAVVRGIERTLGVGAIHHIGFSWEGKLFGGVSLLLRKGQEVQNREVIETLVNQAANAVQRLLAEEILRKSEEKYRTLFEESKDVVYFTGLGGKWLDVNQAGVDLFGFPSKEELMESTFLDRYVSPESREEYLKEMLSQHFVKDYPLVLKRKDGQKINVLVTGMAEKFEQGEITGFRGIMRDVTEQRRMETQLIQSQKMDAIGRLAGGIAHDFNNLLTTVIGNADLLFQMCGGMPTAMERLRAIRETADRAANLTRQLLTMSRNQAVEPRVLNLNEVIRGMEKMFARSLGEDVVTLYRLDSQLALIKADPGQIEQVLLNLLINSRQAMSKGGKVFISTRDVVVDESYALFNPSIAPGRYVQLSVSDTGAGIPVEVMSRIFEPFFTTKPGGTGLGLAIVYGIVKQAGGHIIVYSEPQEGATFKIQFPALVSEQPVAVENEKTAPNEMPSGSETLLVVEDESAILELIRIVLTGLGYQVLTAPNSEEATALSLSHAGTIDLLLSDVVLPGARGPELAEELKKRRAGLKVIFMSGYTDDRIDSAAIREGRLNFLPKPFSPSALARSIRQALDKGRE